MNKRTFTWAERYAVWLHHEKRCWLCLEPLRINETTIDHFLPESLLEDPEQLASIITHWQLPVNFNVSGFENWLPCHQHCNQKKSDTVFKPTPANGLMIERLIKCSPAVQKTAGTTRSNAKKDKVIALIHAALENRTINQDDLEIFAIPQPSVSDMLHLDNGYWLHKNDVARECDCQCDRDECVDNDGKVHCYFSNALSEWVIRNGLYWKCYDEIITCPLCNKRHKRGHVGRAVQCGQPYVDQIRPTD